MDAAPYILAGILSALSVSLVEAFILKRRHPYGHVRIKEGRRVIYIESFTGDRERDREITSRAAQAAKSISGPRE